MFRYAARWISPAVTSAEALAFYRLPLTRQRGASRLCTRHGILRKFPAMRIRKLLPDDWDDLAELIHRSLSEWYRNNLNVERFGSNFLPLRSIPELYEALDPGCCIVAEDEASGRLMGSAFFHPRETHWGIGIVNSHPDFGGQGVARKLMEHILALATADGKPARLVSSAMNLDSFSLYTRLGFVPQMTFQDMRLAVPEVGLPPLPTHLNIRPATLSDTAALADLEFRLNGIRREKDYRHFVENPGQCWHLLMAESDGVPVGFLAAVDHPHTQMIGPGVAENETIAITLLHAILNTHFRGRTILWLAPVQCADLVRQCYA